MDLLVGPTETHEVSELARGSCYVVVDKPAGVLVHRTTWSPERDVMLTRVRDHLGQHVHPVHRLDRPTSGCLLFALEREAIPSLQDALAEGRKIYVAVVRGCADRLHGVSIDRPLKVDGVIREASTAFEVLETCAEPRCSLVVARPSTGRFHQIRRHLAGAGHPIIGDSKHGDTRVNRPWRDRGISRLALHCARLELPRLDLDVRAPWPADLASIASLPGTWLGHLG